jgi:hypothetical protein
VIRNEAPRAALPLVDYSIIQLRAVGLARCCTVCVHEAAAACARAAGFSFGGCVVHFECGGGGEREEEWW